jgi:hypothetical protein
VVGGFARLSPIHPPPLLRVGRHKERHLYPTRGMGSLGTLLSVGALGKDGPFLPRPGPVSVPWRGLSQSSENTTLPLLPPGSPFGERSGKETDQVYGFI